MNIVLFSHPQFLDSTSMPLFASMILDGARKHGHNLECWTPDAVCIKLPVPKAAKKWLGYIDQFIIFPWKVRKRLKKLPKDTIFVFADQALGPWVNLVADKPHAIHCHDFLALRSALGEFPENPVSWTGKLYQKWIKNGFSRGRNFICDSNRTEKDLVKFLKNPFNVNIHTVHNGLSTKIAPIPKILALKRLSEAGATGLENGFILHVGGNQWYKNRKGVLDIYKEYTQRIISPLPLLMVGAQPDSSIIVEASKIPSNGEIIFLIRPETAVVNAAYSAASLLLFPSIAEGFGWPIIEAMACGCIVLTTNDAPMTEVGANFANYLPKRDSINVHFWAKECSTILIDFLSLPEATLQEIRDKGIHHATTFNLDSTIKQYLKIYQKAALN